MAVASNAALQIAECSVSYTSNGALQIAPCHQSTLVATDSMAEEPKADTLPGEARFPRCLQLERDTGKNAGVIAAELFQRVCNISPPPQCTYNNTTDGFIASLVFNDRTFTSLPFPAKRDARFDCLRLVSEELLKISRKNENEKDLPMIFQRADTFSELLRAHTYAMLDKLYQESPIGSGTEKVVASIFMLDHQLKNMQCISLATGNKCITRNNIGFAGQAVVDCHAEILARRGFRRFLYAQLNATARTPENSILEPSGLGKWKVRSHFSFHLFINTAPCGDGRLYSLEPGSEEEAEAQAPWIDRNPGRLRYKIENGMGTVLGNDEFCQTVDSFERLLVGELYTSRVDRAVSKRLQGFQPTWKPFELNHPACLPCQLPYNRVVFVGVSTEKVSVNWNVVDGFLEAITTNTGRRPNGEVSRLAPSSFFALFRDAHDHLTGQKLPETASYSQVKLSNETYYQCKKAMIKRLADSGMGRWLAKPPEHSQFTVDMLQPIVA
ncbi:unnamed protein product, partial [Mesorhabditis spiculigera]